MKRKNKIKYLMAYGHFCSDFVQSTLAVMLPFLIRKFGFSYARASSLVMASNLIGSLIQPVFGYISDKVEKPSLMIVGILAAGLGIAAVGFAPGYAAICVMVVISGMGVAMFHPQGAQMIEWISDRSNKGNNMGMFSFGGNLGFAVGPILAAPVLYAFGLAGSGLFLLPSVIFAVFMLSMGRIQTGNDYREEGSSGPEEPGKDRWLEFGKINIYVICRSIVFSGIGTFLILFLADNFGIAEGKASALLSFYYGVQALSSILSGIVADRIGFKKTLIAAGIILTASLFAFYVSSSPALSVVLLVPLGIGSSLGYSPMVSLGQAYLPNHLGLASGVTLGLSVSAGGIFAPVLGSIGDSHGLAEIFIVMLIVSAMGTVSTFFVSNEAD